MKPIPNAEIGEYAEPVPCRWEPGHSMIRVRRKMKRHTRVYDWCSACEKVRNLVNESGGWAGEGTPKELLAFFADGDEAAWVRNAAAARGMSISDHLRDVVFADLEKRQ